jgi:cobalt-zinc-cadmium efflux system protein
VEGMMLLAILGIFFNGLAVLRLNKGSSINEEMVSLHLLGDVLSWVAVLIGAVVMYFFNVPIIDPILSLFIAGFILYKVIKNLRETFSIVLQGVTADVELKTVTDYLKNTTILKVFRIYIYGLLTDQTIY